MVDVCSNSLYLCDPCHAVSLGVGFATGDGPASQTVFCREGRGIPPRGVRQFLEIRARQVGSREVDRVLDFRGHCQPLISIRHRVEIEVFGHARGRQPAKRPASPPLPAGADSERRSPQPGRRALRGSAAATEACPGVGRETSPPSYFFNPAVQSNTTVNGAVALGPTGVTRRNRLPSGVTSPTIAPGGV